MISKPSLTLEIASALIHEADQKELEEIMKLVEEERNERRKIGI